MKALLVLTALSLTAAQALGAPDEFTLVIKNHTFEPKELRVPAGQKFKILVVNQDPTPAEFESKALNREKVIPGNSTGVVKIGQLKPGRYAFVEEYHENQAGAQGTLIAE